MFAIEAGPVTNRHNLERSLRQCFKHLNLPNRGLQALRHTINELGTIRHGPAHAREDLGAYQCDIQDAAVCTHRYDHQESQDTGG